MRAAANSGEHLPLQNGGKVKRGRGRHGETMRGRGVVCREEEGH